MFKVALLLIAASVVCLASANAIEGQVQLSFPKTGLADLYGELKDSAVAEATLSANKLRTSATTQYAVASYYSGGSCGGDIVKQDAVALNTCMLGEDSGSVIYSMSGSAIFYQTFSDTACKTATMAQAATTSEVVGTCQAVPGNAYSGKGAVQTGYSTSSLKKNGVIFMYYDTATDCSGQVSAGVWGWEYTSNTGSNGCLVSGPDATSSSSITCSGSTATANAYVGGTCQGSPVFSFTSPIGCPSPALDSFSANSLSAQGFVNRNCYTASTDSESSSSCFAGSETVTMESGDIVPISEVVVGDKVLAYSSAEKAAVFSEVVAVPHARNTAKATFQHIELASGADLKVTADHLLPAGACAASLSASVPPLVRAADVHEGDCVLTAQDGLAAVVSNKEVVSNEGIYTIVTNADFVVVNGIVASPFAVNHAVADFVYGIHRVMYRFAPKLLAPVAGAMANMAAYFAK